MDRHQHGKIYQQTLRDAAVNGARYFYKTGTLAVANCLAGYIELAPNKRYRLHHFTQQSAEQSWTMAQTQRSLTGYYFRA